MKSLHLLPLQGKVLTLHRSRLRIRHVKLGSILIDYFQPIPKPNYALKLGADGVAPSNRSVLTLQKASLLIAVKCQPVIRWFISWRSSAVRLSFQVPSMSAFSILVRHKIAGVSSTAISIKCYPPDNSSCRPLSLFVVCDRFIPLYTVLLCFLRLLMTMASERSHSLY